MHETLLLGIAASELTVLLTSDPRRWSRRLILFLTLMIAVIFYSWLVLGVSAQCVGEVGVGCARLCCPDECQC